MAKYYGAGIDFGAIIASTWGTAVDIDAATTGGMIRTMSGFNPRREMIPEMEAGYPGLREMSPGRAIPEISYTSVARWANAIPWVHLFCLTGGETSTQQGGTAAYLHAADFDDDIDGHFYTLAAELTDAAAASTYREFISVKPTGFTMTVDGDGFMDIECRALIDYCEEGINCTVSSVSSLTYETRRLRIPFKICQFRINADSGALDSDDKVNLTNFSLSVDRPFSPNYDAYGDSYTAVGFKSSEPKPDSMVPEILLSIPEQDFDESALWEDDHRLAGAEATAKTFKADLTWAGPNADTGYPYTLKFEFPLLSLTEIDLPVDHQNRIIQPATFRAMKPASAPTGMTGITEYYRLSLTNTRTAIYAKA